MDSLTEESRLITLRIQRNDVNEKTRVKTLVFY